MDIKKLFFDRKAVVDRIGKAKRAALSKAGAFVRTRARSSIRRRKSVSKPGQPPTSRTGKLKRFIFFGYDPRSESVVIGPVKLDRVVSKTAPSALEFGGTTNITVAGKKPGERKAMIVRIGERPYMRPALDKEVEKGTIPAAFRNMVSR